MKQLRNAVTVLAALVLTAVPAHAASETFKTIAYVGVQGNNAYVAFTTPLSVTCAWGNLYIYIGTDVGKGYLSLLLTARAAAKQLSRVDYTKQADGMCTIDLVEM